MFALEDHC